MNELVEELFKKYNKYGIEKLEIENTIKRFLNIYDTVTFDRVSLALNIKIINKIKKENSTSLNNVKEYNSYIKVCIRKNKELKELLDEKYNMDIRLVSSEIYNLAIQSLPDKYDYSVQIYENILIKVNYIIKNKLDTVIELLQSKKYDISFLNDYVIQNRINITNFAKVLDINCSNFRVFLIGKGRIDANTLIKLLDLFNVKSYEELKDKALNHELDVPDILFCSLYDITFLRKFIDNNKIDVRLLNEKLKIKQQKLTDYLGGKNRASKEVLDKLLEIFNVKDYKELKEKSMNNTLEIPECLCNIKYDITFLNDYIKHNGISTRKLADELSITLAAMRNYLLGRSNTPKEVLDKLLEIFAVKNYEELKEKSINNTLERKEYLYNVRYNIKFFNNYIKYSGIDYKKLADELSVSLATIYNYLSGRCNISKDVLDKLLEIFDVKDYEEFARKVNKHELQIPECLIKKEDKIYDIQKGVNAEVLLKLIDIENISKQDYFIILLLFGGMDNKYYSVENISSFLKTDKKHVLSILKKCSKIYINAFNDELEESKIKLLQNDKN